ncbi:hypothetical protein B0H67DRAFT_649264 [Lasiosphaeris hirsuta]|uniref:Ketoreductase domain-containing protein n=1 Tax=Lasiosphaeris hirsuta TaxID=260670 RepID=A0AA39ZWI8_9PEZI|nr:hypothetical protein B0H67DRAFT_649264 [Lasiosphaeris hirsuta]
MLAPLAGKLVAVTGAGGGIGFAIASRFANEGASVVLLGRNKSKLQQALERIRSESGDKEKAKTHSIFPHDVRKLESWVHLAANYNGINILVNSAGVTQTSLFVRTDPPTAEDILATNLHGAIWGCRVIGRDMIRRKDGGCIINVSSLLALKSATGASVYAASKAGLLGLTTSLAQEWGPYGIRVNAILPGYISTDMTKSLEKSPLIEKIPAQRFGTPDEVADAAAFLAKNQYANNCMLNLDGGLSAT